MFKIIGLVSCLIMLGLWVHSVIFVSFYAAPGRQWDMSLMCGRIGFGDGQSYDPGSFSIRTTDYFQAWNGLASLGPWNGFARLWLGLDLPGKGQYGRFHVPIWLFFAAVGAPTGILWWRDRSKHGFCKACRYDLRGNESGICPECGEKV